MTRTGPSNVHANTKSAAAARRESPQADQSGSWSGLHLTEGKESAGVRRLINLAFRLLLGLMHGSDGTRPAQTSITLGADSQQGEAQLAPAAPVMYAASEGGGRAVDEPLLNQMR